MGNGKFTQTSPIGGGGSGGGGFTPTAWTLDFYDAIKSATGNDGAPVLLGSVPAYDTKKEYVLAVVGDFSGAYVVPVGTPTLGSFAGAAVNDVSNPQAIGDFDDPSQTPTTVSIGGGVGVGRYGLAGLTFIHSQTIISATFPGASLTAIGPMAADGAGAGGYLGLSLNDGRFYRNFQASGGGVDIIYTIFSRQVLA